MPHTLCIEIVGKEERWSGRRRRRGGRKEWHHGAVEVKTDNLQAWMNRKKRQPGAEQRLSKLKVL